MSNPVIEPLVVSGNPDDLGTSLPAIRQYVDNAAGIAGLETQSMHRLRLAVDEIAANIIMYSYAETPGMVEATADINDDNLVITLEDAGPEYDPFQRDMPQNLDDPLETRQIGGLGIFLVLKNVDKFEYQRVNDRNRNVFIMKRKRG
jgi:anti-sigma regulatory factor (Ser/Thr protein kinase)